jgi:hypothetical protein
MSIGPRVARAVLPPAFCDLMADARHGRDNRIWEFLVPRRPRAHPPAETVYTRTSTPFSELDGRLFSEDVNSHLLEPSRSFQQHESLTLLKTGGYVLPDGGWIVSGSRRLVGSCLIDADYAARPSFRGYLRARLGIGGSIREVPRLIHLRDRGEANYWHFLNDIIGGRLRLARTTGLGADVPLLIGRRAFEQPFVQDILASAGLARMKVIVQGDELVRYREAVYFQTPRHSLDSVSFFLGLLGAPGGDVSATKRVFVTRSERATRRISNLAEVEAVCRQHGFETVQPDTLPLREQMKLFSRVRYLVAEHGAGVTNIAFRRGAPLGVLEIFPGWTYAHVGGHIGHPPPHYFWLAHMLGFQYDAIAGGATPVAGSNGLYAVDPTLLEQKLTHLLRGH